MQEALKEWGPLLMALLQAGLEESPLLPGVKHLLEKVLMKEQGKREGQKVSTGKLMLSFNWWMLSCGSHSHCLGLSSYLREYSPSHVLLMLDGIKFWHYDYCVHIGFPYLQCSMHTEAPCSHLQFTAGKMQAYLSHDTRI